MDKIWKSLMLCLLCHTAFAQQAPLPLLSGAVYASATVNSIDFASNGAKCGHFIIEVTTASAGNYTPHIQGKNPITGTYYDLLVGSAISTTGTTVLKVCPGIGTVANGSASDMLPGVMRVQLAGAAGQNLTLSVTVILVN